MKKYIILLAAIILSILQIDAQETYSVLYEKAISYEQSVQFDSAAHYFQKAFDVITDSVDWEKKITCLNKVGNNLRKSGDYDNSISIYQQALELGSKNLEKNHLVLASTFQGLGVIYHINSNLQLAKSYYLKALSIRKEKLTKGDLLLGQVYNNLGVLCLDLAQYSEAKAYLQEVLDIRLSKYKGTNKRVGRSYHNLGRVYDETGQYDIALSYYQKAVGVFLSDPNNEYDSAFSLGNIGSIYNKIRQYKKAIKFTEQALGIYQKYLKNTHPKIADQYNNLANVYSNLGDFNKAHEYYDNALNIRLQIFDENHLSISQVYENKSITYLDQENIDKALENAFKALNINKLLLGENHPEIAQNFLNIGNIYKKKKQLDIALTYYFNSLKIRIQHFESNHPIIASNYNNIADIYKKMNRYNDAVKYYQMSLGVLSHNFGENSIEAGIVYGNWSDIYFRMNDWAQSLKYLQKSISCLSTNIDSDDLNQNPDLENVLDGKHLLLFMDAKAENLHQFYFEDKDYNKLKLSLETDFANIKLIEQTLSGIQDIETKQFTRTAVNTVFERAIQTAFELNDQFPNGEYSNLTYTLLEKSKAFQLIEHLNQVNANKFANVPDSLTENEQNLRGFLTDYSKKMRLFELDEIKLNRQISNEKNDVIKDSLVLQLEKTAEKTKLSISLLFKAQRELSDVLNRMENEYPDYFALKYDFSIPPIEVLQNTLLDSESGEKHTAILQYFIGQEYIYSSAITKDSIIFNRSEVPDDFNSLVSQFRSSLISKNFLDSLSIIENYSDSGLELHELLIKNVIKRLNPKINRLVIIPDDILHHVQFDMLLTKSIPVDNFSYLDCSTFDFLFKNYTISQAYSVRKLMDAVAQQKEDDTTIKTLDFCGIEPMYGNRNINNLRTTTDKALYNFVENGIPLLSNELEQVALLFDGESRLLTGQNATESNFLSIIEQFRFKIMHLSSHGLINDEYPEYSKLILTFTNFKDPSLDDCIEIAELYNMTIPADLMVLSACNTGYGQNILSGEGVISIARGVAFAGCSSIVMSMWELEGKSNTVLMTNFYKNILSGMPPDEALREAKLSYLGDQNLGRYDLIPYRWASTVPIGLMQPIF